MSGVNDLPGFNSNIFDQFESMIRVMEIENAYMTHAADRRPLTAEEYCYNVGFIDAARAALKWRDGADTVAEQFSIDEDTLADEMRKRGWLD